MTTEAKNLIAEISEMNQNVFTKSDIIEFLSRNKTQDVIESNGIIINPEKYIVIANGTTIKLLRKEFQLLYYLMSNKNKVIRRHQLLRDVWGDDIIVTDRTVDVHIRKIRILIGSDNIITHKGIGYGWAEK